MKKKWFVLMMMLMVFLCLPVSVSASSIDDEEETEEELQLYYMELSEDYLELSRPGKTANLEVESYEDEDYPFSGVTWSSDDSSVATVSSTGVVTAVGRGTCTVTAVSADNPSVTAECEVYVKKYSVTFHYNNGKADQTKYYDGEDDVTLKSPTRSGYTFAGWYTSSSYSKRIKTIAYDNTKNYDLYAKWTKVKKPGKASIKVSSTSAKKIKVSLKKKVSGADGYQIVVARNKSMTSGKKTYTMTAKSRTLSGMTAGAKYFVKVRAYTSDSTGKKIYGSYSAVATVTVKKAAASTGSSSSTVYITKTGSKYHTGSCRYLKKSKIAISKSAAISQGYTACKVCKP